MPLPSSTINPYNFSNQYAASADIAQGASQLANQTARLGASISASITENNQRKEAQALAPQLAATYQQGFKDILGGNPAQGLSTIYGASMNAATNPFLARMAESANTAANWATNNYLKLQMDTAQGNNQLQMAQMRNAEWDRRQGIENAEYDRRMGIRSQQGENKSLTPLQKFNANNSFNASVSKVFEDLDGATTDAEFNAAKSRLKQMIQGARQIGLSADIEGVFAQASPEERAKIKAAEAEMNALEKDIDTHWKATEWITGNRAEATEKFNAAKAKFDSLKSATESALGRERDQFEKQLQSSPQAQEDLPVQVGNEDIIPIVPDNSAPQEIGEGAVIGNPQTGERMILRNGQWQPFNE